MKNVIINVVGKVYSDGEPETIELTTIGKMTNKNGKWYILYNEAPSSGLGNVKTTVKVENCNIVTLQRSGGHNSRLMVEQGQRHMCHYNTEYGEIMIGVFGKEVNSNLTDSGGELYMKYTIDINADFSSENEVYIKVREASNNHV